MNSNPFASNVAVDSNPFESGRPTVAIVVEEPKVDAVKEALNFSKKIAEAKEEGNYMFLNWMADKARSVIYYLFEFMKKALQLAIFKFALELCAMIIRSLMDALTSGGYGAMDVSTKGVMYHGDAAPPNMGPSGFSGNPFASGPSYSNQRPW